MSPGSSTESYPAFARIGLRENSGKKLNQVTCPDRNSNPVAARRADSYSTVTPPRKKMCGIQSTLQKSVVHVYNELKKEDNEEGIMLTETAITTRIGQLLGLGFTTATKVINSQKGTPLVTPGKHRLRKHPVTDADDFTKDAIASFIYDKLHKGEVLTAAKVLEHMNDDYERYLFRVSLSSVKKILKEMKFLWSKGDPYTHVILRRFINNLGYLASKWDEGDNAGEMSSGSSADSYPAFAHIGLRENRGKNFNQVTCPKPGIEPGPLGFAARRTNRHSTDVTTCSDEPYRRRVLLPQIVQGEFEGGYGKAVNAFHRPNAPNFVSTEIRARRGGRQIVERERAGERGAERRGLYKFVETTKRSIEEFHWHEGILEPEFIWTDKTINRNLKFKVLAVAARSQMSRTDEHYCRSTTSHDNEVDLGDMWRDYIRQDGPMQSRCGTPTSEREDREDHGSGGLTCLPKRRETMVEDSKEQSFVERTREGHCK
ncbi:hypothetical protein ANN_27842 [Periplaneta americana]|uniref:Uncharacterized protein n=1 Tax=Periplaneta americana TaxID=6978 RepID=A0ABQ8RVH1_PERAM|nr:hypothetical protein ANN_27842 [Periplaneta americana]